LWNVALEVEVEFPASAPHAIAVLINNNVK